MLVVIRQWSISHSIHQQLGLSTHLQRLEDPRESDETCACSGSVATMEAAWTPLIVGDLSVPQLRLRDVGQKDILDDAALSFITCLPVG